MYRVIAASLAAAVLFVAGAATAHARVDVSVNIGVPVAAPVVAPVPVPVVDAGYDPYPVAQPDFYVDEPPRFIFSRRLGFFVSVGVPYDIAYVDNGYFLYRGGHWYGAPSYAGPWSGVSYRKLPHVLRQHRYDQIRYYRDHEYRSYLRDRDRYRGRWFDPVRVDYPGRHYGDHRRDRWDDRKDDRWKGRDHKWKDRDHKWKDRDGRWHDYDRGRDYRYR